MPAKVKTARRFPAGASERSAVAVRHFASTQTISGDELRDAPLRWPRPSRLQAPLKAPSKRAQSAMSTLGLQTVGDLLGHLPSDSREGRTVAALRAGEQATIAVQVRRIGARAVRRRGMRPLVEATVFDATGTARATFFNQPWLVERYPPGTRLLLHGKADARGGFNVAHHSLDADANTATADMQGDVEADAGLAGEAVPHYPAAEGISSTQILNLMRQARASLGDVVETLSAVTRVTEGLPDRASALAAMHFPRLPDDLEVGRRRLAYEELLVMQLTFLCRRAQRRARTGAPALAERDALGWRWLDGGLPFALTDDQRNAVEQIHADLCEVAPMQRLLMGEVGSGKTVVALFAMLQAVGHGRQAALMAPTETLAEQHFATVQTLLGAEPVTAALLTGSTPAARRRDILGKLASGQLSLIVGTHALIERDVAFADLAVAVIDEQHRFGVRQRAALVEREPDNPAHVLHMTATPIPRTLALARFGDLDTSTLHELPHGRQPTRTRLLSGERERAEAYARLREELAAGRQAYVVCPLIEEAQAPGEEADAAGGASDLRAATVELSRLAQGELSGHSLALLHGGMRAGEKREAMAAFASGAVDVLVATTVIEVGIDVPNATVMLIENAERFGISQLHQLRGRVGRGEHPATCFLVGPPGSPRLRALATHADGFRLAEIDLALRREGELIGVRQSGAANHRIARMPEDAQLLEVARARAETIVASDPDMSDPEHALLATFVRRALAVDAAAPTPA